MTQLLARALAFAITLVPTSVLATPPSAAPPSHEPSAHGDHGIVWISPIFGNTGKTGLLWILINFVVLMWILEKLLFSKLRQRTAVKHDAIKSELDKATAARTEAESVLADVKGRLGRLDAEAAELLADAKARAEADRKRIIEAAEQEADRIRASAIATAEREAEVRRRQLEAELVDRAVTRAEELLRKQFTPSDQARMVDDYVSQVATALAPKSGESRGGVLVIPGALARRYARALLSLAPDAGARDKYAKDLAALAEITRSIDESERQVITILANRRFPMRDRTKLLEALASRVGADPMVVKFLVYVMERDRIGGLPDIARAYLRMADDAAGRVQAEVVAAAALSPDAVSGIKNALERATGKQVMLKTSVDPELIGGVVAKVGSYVLDGSLKTALARMRTELKEA